MGDPYTVTKGLTLGEVRELRRDVQNYQVLRFPRWHFNSVDSCSCQIPCSVTRLTCRFQCHLCVTHNPIGAAAARMPVAASFLSIAPESQTRLPPLPSRSWTHTTTSTWTSGMQWRRWRSTSCRKPPGRRRSTAPGYAERRNNLFLWVPSGIVKRINRRSSSRRRQAASRIADRVCKGNDTLYSDACASSISHLDLTARHKM